MFQVFMEDSISKPKPLLGHLWLDVIFESDHFLYENKISCLYTHVHFTYPLKTNDVMLYLYNNISLWKFIKFKGAIHKRRHQSRGRGFIKRWSYLISLFSKSDDKGGRGSKISNNWWRLQFRICPIFKNRAAKECRLVKI